MFMPGFTAEASLYKTSGQYHAVVTGTPSTTQVVPQNCPWWKVGLCAAAVAACVASCAAGPQACIVCFANLGMSDCIDCL
jgi:hypothetical protein